MGRRDLVSCGRGDDRILRLREHGYARYPVLDRVEGDETARIRPGEVEDPLDRW